MEYRCSAKRPFSKEGLGMAQNIKEIRRSADKSLAFLISCFPICSITKRIFLGWVKEVRTTKS
jgi:hypothetical protein